MLGKQNLRFATASLLIIFFLSLFTLYQIIASPSSPEVRSQLLKQDEQILPKSINNQLLPNSDNYAKSVENFVQHTISDQVPVRYGSGIIIPSSSQQSTKISDLKNGVKNFKEAETEIQERIERVDKICKKYHLGRYKHSFNGSNDLNRKEPPTPLFSYYFWNRERHLAYCPVYKAGSTSWLVNMMILAGISEQELKNSRKQLSILAREVYGDEEPDAETAQQFLKLLVVRHPFHRLISAYRDKLSNSTVGHEHGTHHFYLKYGQKIVQKFRTDKTIPQIEPTWEEFVRYLLSTDLLIYSDDHWLPAYYSCTPCLVNYDIIAKMETYNRDQEYIIHKTRLQDILKPRWNHKLVDPSKSQSAQIRQYFSQLTKSQIEALYSKYWFDFQLFGYEYKKEFLKYGKIDE